ncbi:YqzE family protein [Bacillus xiapuensis]|uniref:YqzE family protein n=1 Tax=Bacillus xiapuensis TaxID=2014075 RepID=UPI000C2415E5|nr:YqzE family protein [Bacillus xiapuensis]
MSSNELIRYFTQKTLTYFNEPKQDRKAKRRQKKLKRTSLSSRWFGVLPWAIHQWFHRKR